MTPSDADFAVMCLAFAGILAIGAGFMYALMLAMVAWPHRACCGWWQSVCRAHRELSK